MILKSKLMQYMATQNARRNINYMYKNGKVIPVHAMEANKGYRGTPAVFLNLATKWE
jgi:hypothetical protein